MAPDADSIRPAKIRDPSANAEEDRNGVKRKTRTLVGRKKSDVAVGADGRRSALSRLGYRLKKKEKSSVALPNSSSTLAVMSDLLETDPIQEAPSKLEGLVMLKRYKKRRFNRNRRFYARLSNGILKLYKDAANGNVRATPAALEHEFKIDLSQVSICYDDRERRLYLSFRLESHLLVPVDRDTYPIWRDSIQKHRLYRQDLQRQQLLKDNDSSIALDKMEREKTGIKESGAVATVTTANTENVSNETRLLTTGLKDLLQAMSEYEKVHHSAVEITLELNKLLEVSRTMFLDIRAVWMDMRTQGLIPTKPGDNVNGTKMNATELEHEAASLVTALDCSSEDSSESDEEDEISNIVGPMSQKSLRSLEAARNIDGKQKVNEAMPIPVVETRSPANDLVPANFKSRFIQQVTTPPTKPKEEAKKAVSPSVFGERKEKDDGRIGQMPSTVAIAVKPAIVKSEAKPEPRAEPKAEPKPEPKPEAKQEKEKEERPKSKAHTGTIRVRREVLPAVMCPGEAIGFTAIAAVAMKGGLPISTFEPLSILQVICEELRFINQTILRAVNSSDPVERMAYVAAFAMSGYSGMVGRNRKPFNPLLGETFDYFSEDGWKYHAEQVGHHPSTSAVVATHRSFEWWQTISGTAKTTWSGTVEVTSDFPVRLRLHLHGTTEEYVWNKVKTVVQNATAAPENRVIRNEGLMTIRSSSGLEGKLNFKNDKNNSVSGEVRDRRGMACRLVGRWDRGINRVVDGEQESLFELPTLHSLGKNYYGFNRLSMALNELFPDEKSYLPVTDSRFRPDMRYLENGEHQRALAAKQKLETEQRERNRRGRSAQPLWFELHQDEFSQKPMWMDTGMYWMHRERQFKDPVCQNITRIFG